MRVLLYLVLLAFITGALACFSKPARPTPTPTLDCECGRRPRNLRHKRIIGGSNVERREFPWMIYIVHRYEGFLCGGTLISARTVLTAAHCLEDDKNPQNYNVVVGERFQRNDKYAVESLECHADYVANDEYMDYDYAIIQLSRSVRFTETVYSICLPKDARNDDFRYNAIGIGWGVTKKNEETSSLRLKKATFKTEDTVYRCTSNPNVPLWVLAMQGERRTPRMICLKGSDTVDGGKTSVGRGDSGGPLMVEVNPGQENAYFIQTGIFSFGDQDHLYSVAARVSNQIDWIKDRIKGSVCKNPADDDDVIIDL